MNKKYLIYIILPVALGLILVYGFFKKDLDIPLTNNQEVKNNQSYSSDEYGFSFEYPDAYVLEIRDIDTVYRKHKTFILMPKGYIPPEGGEGPTTINIDVYQNSLDKQSIEAWIKGNALSNYKLGDGLLTSGTVSGKESLSYNWDGLYRGHTVVFEHNQNIIAVSVTYLEVSDRILADYENLLDSFKFKTFPVVSKLPQTLLENYFKENISNISPQKEVLGGKFYITELKLNDGTSGVVNYEDGHIALVADFTYSISSEGKIVIDSFKIRK